jgi:hypothetical protein
MSAVARPHPVLSSHRFSFWWRQPSMHITAVRKALFNVVAQGMMHIAHSTFDVRRSVTAFATSGPAAFRIVSTSTAEQKRPSEEEVSSDRDCPGVVSSALAAVAVCWGGG